MKRIFVLASLGVGEQYQARCELVEKLCRAVMDAGHAPFHQVMYRASTPEGHLFAALAAEAWLRVSDEMWIYAESEDECDRVMRETIRKAHRYPIPVRVVWMPAVWRVAASAPAPIDPAFVDECNRKEDEIKNYWNARHDAEAAGSGACAVCGAPDQRQCAHAV